jgi:hypothetical protein
MSEVESDAARERIEKLLPADVNHREGWAIDIAAAFQSLEITPDTDNICAVLAVAAQESNFQVNPPVAGLPKIARREIDARAARYGIPLFAVHAAFQLQSPTGESYDARLSKATTEKALSDIFDDFIGMVPLGKRLFADWNPVRTAGPMQVSIAFAEKHAAQHRYPYQPFDTVRAEVFTRRGGLYFGIAHLLDYPVTYDDMAFRFADYNAGHYASRNAALQNAISIASGAPLALDGDLVGYGADAGKPSKTEEAVRRIGRRIDMNDAQIRSDLERGEAADFDHTQLYKRVFALAEKKRKRSLPHAMAPQIRLQSPKITRTLTTDWFMHRVDDRYERCVARSAALH